MKKFLKGLLLIAIILIFSCSCSKNNDKHIKKITVNELKEKLENKDSFVLYVGKADCSHCNSYKPTLIKVLKDYDITIYHVDSGELEDDEIEEFEKYVTISGTPTIIFFEDGDEESTLNRIVGETTYEATVEKFKVNGYIK